VSFEAGVFEIPLVALKCVLEFAAFPYASSAKNSSQPVKVVMSVDSRVRYAAVRQVSPQCRFV